MVKCVERKIQLSGEEVSFDCELLAIREGYAVLKYVIDGSRIVDGLLLPAGTITLALYYPDRSYNLYYWIAPRESSASGSPSEDLRKRPPEKTPWTRDVACYFNIVEPVRLSPQVIAYRDLVVDVLVLPDGTTKVLDESELPEHLNPGLRHRIAAVRDEILANYARIIDEAREILMPFAAAT